MPPPTPKIPFQRSVPSERIQRQTERAQADHLKMLPRDRKRKCVDDGSDLVGKMWNDAALGLCTAISIESYDGERVVRYSHNGPDTDGDLENVSSVREVREWSSD
jgi:hypothetical protein